MCILIAVLFSGRKLVACNDQVYLETAQGASRLTSGKELMSVVYLQVRFFAQNIIVLPALLVSCSFKIRRRRFC